MENFRDETDHDWEGLLLSAMVAGSSPTTPNDWGWHLYVESRTRLTMHSITRHHSDSEYEVTNLR